MRLTERYYMMTPCGLVEVKGKKYNDDYAITYNHHRKVYNITHIKSGLCLSQGFPKLKDCLLVADVYIAKGNSFLEENPKHLKRIIKAFDNCVKQGLIEKIEFA